MHKMRKRCVKTGTAVADKKLKLSWHLLGSCVIEIFHPNKAQNIMALINFSSCLLDNVALKLNALSADQQHSLECSQSTGKVLN